MLFIVCQYIIIVSRGHGGACSLLVSFLQTVQCSETKQMSDILITMEYLNVIFFLWLFQFS